MKHTLTLRQLLTQQKSLWVIAWAFGVLTVVSVLGLVMVAGWFVTASAVAGVVGMTLVHYGLASLLIRVFAMVRTLARYGDLMVSHHAVFGLLKDLRVRFFQDWAKKGQTFNPQSSSQKMHRLVKDIDTLDEFPLRLVSPLVVTVLSLLLMGIVITLLLPQALLWTSLLALVLVVAVVVLRRGVALAQKESILLEARKSTLIDALPALTQLLIWGRWADKMGDISRLDDKHHALTMQIHSLRRNASFAMQVVMALVVVGVLWVAHQVLTKTPATAQTLLDSPLQLSPALVLALVLGLFGLIEIVIMLVAEPLALGRSISAKTRLNELIKPIATLPKTPISSVQTITLDHVSVKVPNAIFGASNINATFDTARPVLLMGVSGAGKSTLLATLAGEIAPVGGQILVDGAELGSVELGRQMGFLGQNVDIFDQSLRDNLRLGKPAPFDPFAHPDDDDDELWAVLDKVGLSDWASTQPKGLDTPLGEYGMAVSGGQARRIALARLLLDPKQVLLLDEPFAGLDNDTRKKVWQSLTELQQQGHIGILIIATHQMSDEMAGASVLKIDKTP